MMLMKTTKNNMQDTSRLDAKSEALKAFDQLVDEGRRKGYVRRSDLEHALQAAHSAAHAPVAHPADARAQTSQRSAKSARGMAKGVKSTQAGAKPEPVHPHIAPDIEDAHLEMAELPESDAESDEEALDLDDDSAVEQLLAEG